MRGGVGNQLFIYAAARALALRNGAELWLDARSALDNDPQRAYRLDAFAIAGRLAPAGSFFVSTPRWRRTPIRFASRLLPYRRRSYIEQPWARFVPQLLTLRVAGDVYLDGFWQSEAYFAGCADTIRRELTFRHAPDAANAATLDRIQHAESIAVHCRRGDNAVYLPERYYSAAAGLVATQCAAPRFFVFADDREWARAHLSLPGSVEHVCHNTAPGGECEDLRLMAACRHIITANSTFSWWGAWLGARDGRLVVCPEPDGEWGVACRIPDAWRQVAWR